MKWKVGPVAKGPYRSFEKRGWPMAENAETGESLFMIWCKDEYTPERSRGEQDHAPLFLYVAHRANSEVGFTWRKLKTEYAKLADAKRAAKWFFETRPAWFVNKTKDGETP